MIPQTIHYCWYGGKPMQSMHLKCIDSWKEHLPDFTFKKWDEANSPLDASPFVRDAYRLKRWAFVADYVRIHALLSEGGIYFDTDMLVLKSFDSLLEHQAFAGFEDGQNVNFAVAGSVPDHSFLHECLTCYDKTPFDSAAPPIIPRIISTILRRHGMTDAARQKVAGIDLYPPEYFYPWPFVGHKDHPDFWSFIQPESFAVHLWNHSWKSPLPFKKRIYRFIISRLPEGLVRFANRLKAS